MIIAKNHYINLSTQKRNGSFVNTPVWFACGSVTSDLYVYTVRDSGKVKRIRNFCDVRIAHCNVIGRLRGPWMGAKAYFVNDETEVKYAYSVLRQKYRWRFFIADICSKIARNFKHRQIIKLKMSKQI